MLLTSIALLLIGILGYLAQSIGLCLVRGVDEATKGKPAFLIAILCSGSFTWLVAMLAGYFDLSPVFISFELSFYAVLGGMLFGIGATFNNGCGVSTISKLARGNLVMLVTVLGWFIGWYILTLFMPDIQIIHYDLPIFWQYGFLIFSSVIILFFMLFTSKCNKRLWLSMLAIGFMASIVFLIEPKWTPSALLKDLSYALINHKGQNWPSLMRFVLILSLITGMLIAAIKTKTFKFKLTNVKHSIKHLFSGICMGVGAAIAGGGNDSQLLLALPSLSPAGFATVFFMLLGIYMSKKLFKV
jgi:hypothetical protein